MWTDDYAKRSYLGVHAFWIDSSFRLHNAMLALKHFESPLHSADYIKAAIPPIADKFGFNTSTSPFVLVCGSNVKAALKGDFILDCMAHRLHTCISVAWKETQNALNPAKEFEDSVSELSTFVKQAFVCQSRRRFRAPGVLCEFVCLCVPTQQQLSNSISVFSVGRHGQKLENRQDMPILHANNLVMTAGC